MVREFSAGGVVTRRIRGQWHIAAIEPNRSETARKSALAPVLALPKGLVDAGEKPDQTAVREVFEETGLTAEVITKLKDIKYIYVRSWGDGERVFKIVSFYLLRYRSGNIGEISQEMRVEVRQALWVPLEEARQKLAYKGEREVAAMAANYLAEHPQP